jgi:hypothetical protein
VQYVTVGHTAYYLEKTLRMLVIVALVALGAVARHLTGRRWLALAAAALVVVAAGGPMHTRPGSLGLRLALGAEKGSPQGGRDAILITRRYPDGGAAANVDLMSTPYANYFATLFAAVMQRDFPRGYPWYLFLFPGTGQRTLADMEQMVADSPDPVRLFVRDRTARTLAADQPTNVEAAEYLAGRYPGKVTIVYAD